MSSKYQLRSGARWLAPFLVLLALTVLGLAFMLVYPHLGQA